MGSAFYLGFAAILSTFSFLFERQYDPVIHLAIMRK